eukprot:TRINITY_DN70387_c0_g1_i1.p1 TRINITY_DN70387_c0_g1~~TRINITY_DN70387_c0_g1_i1.p1  ORF type:complete len:161 (+),score=42.52 TRINITY_DN70387_c0_g1_i1:31-483(+)
MAPAAAAIASDKSTYADGGAHGLSQAELDELCQEATAEDELADLDAQVVAPRKRKRPRAADMPEACADDACGVEWSPKKKQRLTLRTTPAEEVARSSSSLEAAHIVPSELVMQHSQPVSGDSGEAVQSLVEEKCAAVNLPVLCLAETRHF